MRLLDRYLLRELLVPLGYCLSGFYLLWASSDLIAGLRELQSKQLLPRDILEYYLARTPEFLVVVLPVALLLALLYSLTNHARHHEITAIRAAGISLWRLSLPYLAVGLLCSVALFVLNEYWAPGSADAAEAIRLRRVPLPPDAPGRNQVRNLGFTNSRDGRLWQVPLYHLDTGVMINPQVIWVQPDSSRLWIKADRAELTNGVWTFLNVRTYRESRETAPPLVPLLETNVLTYPEFSETPEQIRSEIKISGGMTLRGARKADIPISEILNYLRLHPRPAESDGSWLFTKLHGRLAAPWTCLVVVLIAIPFGAASGRRNVFVGVASSILICFLYFVLQQLCLALGAGGHLPAWAAGWLPNIAFGLTGLWLTNRVR